MVAEFKKEAVLKEIGRLSTEVDESKRIIEEADERQQCQDSVLNDLNIGIDMVCECVQVHVFIIPWFKSLLSENILN